MKCRRYMPVIALVMLLASLFSTETAEVWCRVAVGAAEGRGGDRSPSTCGPDGHAARVDDSAAPSFGHCSKTVGQGAGKSLVWGKSLVLAPTSDTNVVDVPTFSLPQLDAIVPRAAFGRVIIPIKTMPRAAETRGPPTWADRFDRPPLRAPPLS